MTLQYTHLGATTLSPATKDVEITKFKRIRFSSTDWYARFRSSFRLNAEDEREGIKECGMKCAKQSICGASYYNTITGIF